MLYEVLEMIDFSYACKEISEYFDLKLNKKKFESIYENDESWIFYVKTDEIEYGGFGAEFLKSTGEIKDFILPSNSVLLPSKSFILASNSWLKRRFASPDLYSRYCFSCIANSNSSSSS